MSTTQQIVLIPGFFGFANLGQLVYFAHVREFLTQALGEFGLQAEVHAVATEPTASIRRRAACVLQAVARAGGDAPVHLVGHSTGGLDARLAVTPGVSLPDEGLPVEQLAQRVRTVVGVSTPHHGTPLASFFTTLQGKQLLRLLSLLTVYALRFGRAPLSVLLRLGAFFVRLDDRLGWRDTVADQVYEQLLADFQPERREAVRAFFERAGKEQTLVTQLTPDGIDMFNAATADRPGVRYGSVVTTVDRPRLRSAWRLGLDPYTQATHGLFAALSHLTARGAGPQLATPEPAQQRELTRPLQRPLQSRDNDGIVPALSQLWGELICAARADHLDVIGHFGDAGHQPPHYDWFASGSAFDRARFEAIWRRVAAFIARAPAGSLADGAELAPESRPESGS